MDNLAVHKTSEVMEIYKKLRITPIFNAPYSPDFYGIESYFSLVKAEYKKLFLQHLMKDISIETHKLVDSAVYRVDDEKVKRCVKYDLSKIKKKY